MTLHALRAATTAQVDYALMRSPPLRLRGLVAFAIIAVGAPGTDVRHGIAHDFEREHLAADHGTEARHPQTMVEDGHHDDHPHAAVDVALRDRVPPAYLVAFTAPPAAQVPLGGFNGIPDAAAEDARRSDHSTGPPPRLRAPPVIS